MKEGEFEINHSVHEETPGEKLKETVAPHLKKLRTYVAAGLVLFGAHEGAKTELKYKNMGDAFWNPVIESTEDIADALHERFGISEEAHGVLTEMKVVDKDLLTVAEEQLRGGLGAGGERKLSDVGRKWAYQHARHLVRLNDVKDVRASIHGQTLQVDGYGEVMESGKFVNPPENVLLERNS